MITPAPLVPITFGSSVSRSPHGPWVYTPPNPAAIDYTPVLVDRIDSPRDVISW